jgi:hypothetical protein
MEGSQCLYLQVEDLHLLEPEEDEGTTIIRNIEKYLPNDRT